MKLISLNICGGKQFTPLMDFIKTQSQDTDIFCFQELLDTRGANTDNHGYRANILAELKKALPDFEVVFTILKKDFDYSGRINPEQDMGDAIFIKKNIPIESHSEIYVSGDETTFVAGSTHTLPCKATAIKVTIDGKALIICNLHGTPLPLNKLDDPNRLEQSKKIIDFVNQFEGEKIIVGDFNLMPETESIKMFETAGFKDLIKDFGIKTTRGNSIRLIHPEYEHGPYGFQEFADYAFVTPQIEISKFEVPDIFISDHLPMIIEFK